MLFLKEEKFSIVDMVWGGLSWRGLKPVFMSDFMKKYKPAPKSINGLMYADLVRDIAAPAVQELYLEGDASRRRCYLTG